VTPVDAQGKVLEQANLAAPSSVSAVVAGKRDEVEVVDDRQRSGEVGDEDERRGQRGDEDRLAALVVCRDLGAELLDAPLDLLAREVDLPDALIG
jgi:hypothetical protein